MEAAATAAAAVVLAVVETMRSGAGDNEEQDWSREGGRRARCRARPGTWHAGSSSRASEGRRRRLQNSRTTCRATRRRRCLDLARRRRQDAPLCCRRRRFACSRRRYDRPTAPAAAAVVAANGVSESEVAAGAGEVRSDGGRRTDRARFSQTKFANRARPRPLARVSRGCDGPTDGWTDDEQGATTQQQWIDSQMDGRREGERE